MASQINQMMNNLPPCPPEYTPEEWREYHEDPCSFCIKDLTHADPSVRCSAADILRGLAWDAAPAIPALIAACNDEDASVRPYVVHAFSEIAEAVHSKVPDAVASLQPAVPVLIGLLDDEELEVQCLAASALGAIGPMAKSAVPVLQKKLEQAEDEELREYLEAAIEMLG